MDKARRQLLRYQAWPTSQRPPTVILPPPPRPYDAVLQVGVYAQCLDLAVWPLSALYTHHEAYASRAPLWWRGTVAQVLELSATLRAPAGVVVPAWPSATELKALRNVAPVYAELQTVLAVQQWPQHWPPALAGVILALPATKAAATRRAARCFAAVQQQHPQVTLHITQTALLGLGRQPDADVDPHEYWSACTSVVLPPAN